MAWYANPLAWCELDEPENDDIEDEFDAHPYLHRDAARAWQAFRDFLNGTAEEWAEREADAYADGENDGFDRGVAAVHELREGMSPPDLLPPWDRGEQR